MKGNLDNPMDIFQFGGRLKGPFLHPKQASTANYKEAATFED